jgi:hypothetical protein
MYASAKEVQFRSFCKNDGFLEPEKLIVVFVLYSLLKIEHKNLHPLILENIRPCSIITFDGWAAYGDLSNFGFTHLVVNHSENFVVPVSGATTNNVENMWQKLKYPHEARYGTHRTT